MKKLCFITILLLSACANNSKPLYPSFDSEAANINTQLGQGYAQQGRYQRALLKYKKALDFDPELIAAHIGIIDAAEALGDRALTIDFLDRFMEIAPESPQPYQRYALFKCRSGDFRSAEKILLDAHTNKVLEPKAAVYNYLTACARNVNRADLAALYNANASALSPKMADVALQTALNGQQFGQQQAALAAYEQYFQLGGKDSRWLQAAAQLAEQLGDIAAAISWQQRIKTLYPLLEARGQ